ncbi:MAG: zf-HC2 domain-containing protein [Candidatus Latescibacteria bacterium]|jgi:hypothetical protein|nr:zf-HC2 domain-containing protein [Candidatus Latescibacterota bacterium]
MAENDKICNQFDHVLWAFMDGDMSERHRIFWETHTKECERCQTLREEANALVLTYYDLPGHEAPEILLQEILGRAKSRNPIKRAWQHLRQSIPVPGQRIWQSSLIGAVVLVGGFLLVTAVRHRRSA